MDSESRAHSQSLAELRSESKVLVGHKRDTTEAEETPEISHKRVKLRDTKSVWPSKAEAVGTRSTVPPDVNPDSGALDLNVNVSPIGVMVGVPACTEECNKLGGHNTVHPEVNSDSRALDLNVNVGPESVMSGVDAPACIEGPNNFLTSAKEEKNRGFYLDLNAEDMSSSIKNNPFYPFKSLVHLKSRDDSECGSSAGPLDENDSMRVWKGLKKNNYMSASGGAVPMPIPKTRGRKKHNNDVMKKKIELAKKEQVDRFAKVAAPSGLLNGLNPGIINHVRNSKQVHSIIEALVRSETTENPHSGSKQTNQIKRGRGEHTERENPVDINSSGVNRSGLSCEDVLLERRHKGDCALFAKSNNYSHEVTRGDDDSYMEETIIYTKIPSQCNVINKDDGLALKLSSSLTVASENTSCFSNEESGNLTSVTSLSVKAADVASLWLELLNQDIRGRLAALRPSKKRVRAVISTELPLLMSKEFSSNLEKDLYMRKGSTLYHPDKASADAHAVRWSTLFGQMDKSLSEEESNLENWLNQVNEMQLNCERCLSNSLYNASKGTAPTGNNNRLGEAYKSEKDLAVRAAAASIYSTCNFLLAMGNQPCC